MAAALSRAQLAQLMGGAPPPWLDTPDGIAEVRGYVEVLTDVLAANFRPDQIGELYLIGGGLPTEVTALLSRLAVHEAHEARLARQQEAIKESEQ